MPRIRIVFDASPLLVHKTGVGYYTERLVTNLAAQYPDEIELVGFYYNFLGRRPIDHLPKAPNVRFHAVRFTPSKIVYQLRRWGVEFPVEYLSGTSADFILYPNFLSYPSRRNTPSAPVIHDLTFIDMPETVSAKNQRDLERFVPKAIERSSFVITVSEFGKAGIAKAYGVPPENILVTPIPSEPPRTISAERRKALLKKAGIDKPYILFVGTIEPRKNLPTLMHAYAALPESIRSKYCLAITGRFGWNCENEEATLAQMKNDGIDVRHLGYVDEDTRAALFIDTTLFVSASNYEGFGMPVTEAMGYGAPVAVSDIPVFREVAGPDALYFDQTKPEAIAGAIQKVLNDDKLRTKLIAVSKKQLGQFDWQRVAASVYDHIQKAVERS